MLANSRKLKAASDHLTRCKAPYFYLQATDLENGFPQSFCLFPHHGDRAGPAAALLSLPICLCRDSAVKALWPGAAGGISFQVTLTVLTQRQRETRMPPGKGVSGELSLPSSTRVNRGRHPHMPQGASPRHLDVAPPERSPCHRTTEPGQV